MFAIVGEVVVVLAALGGIVLAGDRLEFLDSAMMTLAVTMGGLGMAVDRLPHGTPPHEDQPDQI